MCYSIKISALSARIRIYCLYLMQANKTHHHYQKNGIPSIIQNYIRWWGSISGAQESVKYVFIFIILRSTLIWSSTFYSPIK